MTNWKPKGLTVPYNWPEVVKAFGDELDPQRKADFLSTDFFKPSKTDVCTDLDAENPLNPFNYNLGLHPLNGQYLDHEVFKSFNDFIKTIHDIPLPPEYSPVLLKKTDLKKYKYNHTEYDPKAVYMSPYRSISHELYNDAVHYYAKSVKELDISAMYCGYFNWNGTSKLLPAAGTTGCYGSCFSSYSAEGTHVLLHGDNLVGWKTPTDQDYVSWLLDQKRSPFAKYLANDIIIKDDKGNVKGHILLNTHEPAAVFANLGITIRALQTHQRKHIWDLARDYGFTRPEAWILLHLLTKGSKETDPLQVQIADYSHSMYLAPGGRVNFNNIFTQKPLLHKNLKPWNPQYKHSLERECYEKKGYNPSNAIWDNNKARVPNKHEKISRWFITEVTTIINKRLGEPKRTLGAPANLQFNHTQAELSKYKDKYDWSKENLIILGEIRGAMDAMRAVFKNSASDEE